MISLRSGSFNSALMKLGLGSSSVPKFISYNGSSTSGKESSSAAGANLVLPPVNSVNSFTTVNSIYSSIPIIIRQFLERSRTASELKKRQVPKSQPGISWGPRPQNSDPRVPRGLNMPRTHVLRVWSRSDGYCESSPRVGLFRVSRTPIPDSLSPIRFENCLT
ncbi:hypothetical protein L3X38_040632 [Prunus dulcis]|uniref:Uncharacterized protein n=1 Tax=Prunus dulcis TaxID=3755 RepID=A0AAD4V9E5_PRUDU|nr:hypothetical protein L3X38_040632 [Prunus dulcis]